MIKKIRNLIADAIVVVLIGGYVASWIKFTGLMGLLHETAWSLFIEWINVFAS